MSISRRRAFLCVFCVWFCICADCRFDLFTLARSCAILFLCVRGFLTRSRARFCSRATHPHPLQSDEEEVKVELKHHQPKPKPPPERKGKRASLADAIGEWPTLHKVTKKKKVVTASHPPPSFSVGSVADT